MKIDFNRAAIFDRFAKSYKNKLDSGLNTTLRYIDEITPIRTWDLLSHNKVKAWQINWMNVVWSVYNDLNDYELDVEKGLWRPMTYHRYGTAFKYWEWAHMFELWFWDAIWVLLTLLKWDVD
jgi:hypothetical protein